MNLHWKLNEKLAARDFKDLPSRDAFRAGYSDGFYGYERNHGDWPVQPYSAGYWEASADRSDHEAEKAGPS